MLVYFIILSFFQVFYFFDSIFLYHTKNTFIISKINILRNPYTGLSFPNKWNKYRSFNDSLENELLKNQNEILYDYFTADSNDDDDIPRFKYIDIAKYGNGEKFNYEAFLSDVITEFKKLAQLTNTIDEILKRIKPKRK